VVLLVSGILLFIVTAASLVASLVTSPGRLDPRILQTNAALSMTSKIGLIATATAMLRKAKSLAIVAALALGSSLVDSAYYLMVVMPRLQHKSKEEAYGYALGAAAMMIASAVVYVSILVYSRRRTHAASAPIAAP
jgi:hypothetical protein